MSGLRALPHAVASAPDPDGWPDPPAPAAFAGLAGALVEALAPHTEADPAAVLAQLIVAVGSMIGPGPHYQVGASRHGANEFVVLVGPSGAGRKGSAWDLVRRSAPGSTPPGRTAGWCRGCLRGKG